MTKHWCPECKASRFNYVDKYGNLRGIECGHRLESGV